MILFYTLNALAFLLFVADVIVIYLFYKQDKEVEKNKYPLEVNQKLALDYDKIKDL